MPIPAPFRRRLAAALICLAPLALPAITSAQTVSITEGVQTHASLSGATITLSGKSELRLTAASAPLSGSVVNLTSTDCAVLFTNVRPSVVVSSYLSQLRINGSAAVNGSNCRVVQHELGAIVLPHAPSFQPLQAFAGPDFSGSASSFSQYTYYNSAGALGSLNRNISSFKLKRGYMATFSTQTNGAGPSRIYIAQDGDLEIGRLPAELDNAIRFVRVLPWRWVSKKGSCDVSAATLDSSWFYNWDNNQNSPLDWEYVPIRQQRWWPGYPTNKPDSTHLLGFNEPDNPVEDAYETLGEGSIDTAISVWPELLATGLRVGSPAVTDGGVNWLYEFMDKADAAQLRVDYVAIHFYRCGYTATQLYNWLYDIHVRTGRPIWLTEFNNGANWTTCADPTYAQNATRIGEFIEMMDNAPFIERYAVYSRVEGVRQMTYDEGGLTPAGTVYKNNASPISYAQRIPRTGSRGISELGLDGDTLDRSGFGNNAVAAGRPAYTTGKTGQALRLDGATSHVQLPPDVVASAAFSFAAWVYWDGGANWQRIFDFGRDTNRYMFLTPSSGSGTLRFAIKNGGSEQIVQTASALPVGQWSHVAVTLSGGTARLYLNGAQVASGAVSITPAQLDADLNYLGKSQFPDPLFAGRLDEVRVADFALSPAQISALQTNTPPAFTSATLNGGNATQNVAFSGSIAGSATDPDSGDTLTYSKLSGPTWLNVAANGALSGTPTFNDDGVQEFIVTVTDSAGATDSAVLTLTLPTVTGNGTWITNGDGLWSDTTKWSSGFPANGSGFTANFATLDISADRTVTLTTSRGIGNLAFGDNSGGQNWTLAAAGGASLTLDTGTTAAPAIAVNQNTATLAAPLEGTNGLAKIGNGTLVLAAANTLSGTVHIDTASTGTAQGVVRAAHPGALSAVSTISIRNNNGGSSTLELDGSLGGVASSAAINLSGRNNTVQALRNLVGANSLAGTLTLQSGGSGYLLQSDAGTLSLGAVTSAATGARTLTFQGSGNFALAGIASNGSATDGLGFVKNGSGTLSLTAAHTATGNVTVNAGTLSILGTGALYAGAYNPSSTVTVNSGATLELDRWGYGFNHGTYRTQALGGLAYAPARLVLNGGRIRYTGGAAGAPPNPAESPYGPGFTVGAAGAILEAAKLNDTWTVKNDTRGSGPVASDAGGTLTLTGEGHGIFDKVLPGTGGLLKSGSGIWTLTLANTYTGTTTIGAGTLRVNGSTATGSVIVANGGTLAGAGTVGGPVTLQSGATLAPGSGGIGRLTLSGSASFLAGATASFEINKNASARDSLAVGGTLALGGTLAVTNLSGTLAAGDAFDLFDASATTGAFTTFSLPALSTGLVWDSSTLATDGVLRVALAPVEDYAAWAAGQNLPAGQEGADADPDGDGLPNAFEWLFDADPLAADAAAHGRQSVVRALGVAEYPAAEAGKTYLTLTARIRKNHTGMTLVPQAAADLDQIDAPAASAAVASFLVSDEGDFETRTWLHTTPVEDSATGRAFLRLKLVAE